MVNLRYVTSGGLKTSRSDFKPDTGQIKFALSVEGSEWRPKLGLDKWNPTSRTFTEVCAFKDTRIIG